jgi:AAA family ATP:ADP antiporter
LLQIKALLKKTLQKFFDIREGEHQKVLLLQFNIFLIVFTLLIIKPIANAKFISVIGIERLPLVFVLVAISAMAVSTIYSKALSSKSLRKVTTNTLIVSIVMLVFIGVMIQLYIAEEIMLYVLYIGVAIFGVLTTSQFWIMANLAFENREAKRLFGFIGAGPIVGGVAGGYFTSIVASYVEGTNLLFVAALLLCACIPLNNLIWRKHIKQLNTFQQKKRLTDFADHPFLLIKKSRHLSFLALLIGLGVLVSKLVEFQFSSIASQNFTNSNDLTAFFGFWFSTFNVVSLVIQLFLTRRIVGVFGVGTSLFVLPGGVIFGSFLLLFTPVLWASVFTKLWEVSVKQSINKSATELLALPIPANIKSQTKSFIDVFVDLAATGLAGLLLIFLVNGFDLSVRSISILSLAILAIWIWVALQVRKEYIKTFQAKLTQADKKSTKELMDYANISVISGLKKALNFGTENQVLYVLEKVRQIPDKRMFEDVAIFVVHSNAKIRIAALKCVYFLDKTIDRDVLDSLIVDVDIEVRFLAFSQLYRQSRDTPIVTINSYLTHENPMISGAALTAMSNECRNNDEMKKLLKIEQRIREKIDYLSLIENSDKKRLFKIIIIRSIGRAGIDTLFVHLSNFMLDEDEGIVNEAILAAGYTMSPEFIDQLIPFLEKKKTRFTAQQALLQYGVGIIPLLELQAQSNVISQQISLHIPSVLEQLDSKIAVNALLGFLQNPDVLLRLEALRSLHNLKRNFPHLNISKKEIVDLIIDEAKLYKNTLAILYKQNQLLPVEGSFAETAARSNIIDIVERRLDSTLERIFRLMGLRYPPEEIMSAYESINSQNEHLRQNAVEFLDSLLEPNLKRTLVPIAENAILNGITSSTIEQLNIIIPSELECLEQLLKSRDIRLKLAVLKLIEVLNDNAYNSLLESQLQSKNEKVKEQASRVYALLNS